MVTAVEVDATMAISTVSNRFQSLGNTASVIVLKTIFDGAKLKSSVLYAFFCPFLKAVKETVQSSGTLAAPSSESIMHRTLDDYLLSGEVERLTDNTSKIKVLKIEALDAGRGIE